ncbi:hypothetical protein GGI43DRAFT_377481 [Trichoderma evansii]
MAKDASSSILFCYDLVPNNEFLACGKEGNQLDETPSVLLARMLRQQNHPRLFKAGSTATAAASTPQRKAHHDLPQHPSHQPQGGRHPVFAALKTWDIPSVLIMG